MIDLTVITDEGSKGRSFTGTLLAHATANGMWAGGGSGDNRPVWAMIAVGDGESMPLIRNLQAGKKAAAVATRGRGTEQWEWLKSAGYEYHGQKREEGHVWTVFLPELFRLDPGMAEHDQVRFVTIPDDAWLSEPDEETVRMLAAKYRRDVHWNAAQQAEADAATLADMRYVTRVAPLFCAYLDRRTRCPLIPDPRFYALVLAAMLDAGQAGMAMKSTYREEWGRKVLYTEDGVSGVGLLPGIACHVSHERLEPLLAECVVEYERTR